MKEQDLLSIKKFSEVTGITQAALRHYDKVGLFQPIKRGDNGYRFYSARQAVAINFISVLNSVNIPIKKIGEIKKDKSPELMSELLRKKEFELNQELYRLQQAYGIIHIYREIIQAGLDANEHEISIRQMTAAPIELGPPNDFSSGYIYDSFFSFLERMVESKVNPSYPAGGFYENIDVFTKAPGRPSRYFSYVPSGKDTKEAGMYLTAYARGYYGELGDAPQRIQKYALENEVDFIGPVYEMYLHDEITVDDCNQYLIQVSVQVKRRNAAVNYRYGRS